MVNMNETEAEISWFSPPISQFITHIQYYVCKDYKEKQELESYKEDKSCRGCLEPVALGFTHS